MVDITLFEVQFPEAQFNAPFARTGGDDDADATSESGDRPAGSAIAALLVLVGLATLAWYLRRGR